jgi:hypothetical protein
MQIVLLPLSTSWMMNNWTDSRIQTELQDAAFHVGSTIQQLYLSLNRDDVLPGTIKKAPDVPTTIESHIYLATGALKTANSTKILNLYFILQGARTTANTSVTLGPNAAWQPSTFMSNATNAFIKVQKAVDSTLTFSFG